MIASNYVCASMLFAQHLLQQIFIGKTEIPPLCPDDEMIQDIDAE
jgi:hypothetical protein